MYDSFFDIAGGNQRIVNRFSQCLRNPSIAYASFLSVAGLPDLFSKKGEEEDVRWQHSSHQSSHTSQNSCLPFRGRSIAVQRPDLMDQSCADDRCPLRDATRDYRKVDTGAFSV